MIDVPASWRAILALDDERQFSRAAARLGMSQPQLSRLIAKVESRLGMPIFQRRPRVRATHAGEMLIAAIRSATGELEGAVAKAAQIVAGQRGEVIIGFASTAMTTPFPLWLKAFSSQHPDIVVTLKEMHSSEHWDALQAGAIDVAIGRENLVFNGMASKLLFRECLTAALPTGHSLNGKPRLKLAELAGESFVMFDRSCAPSLYDSIFDECRAAGFTPRLGHLVREWHTIFALVAAQHGVALVPQSLQVIGWPDLCFRNFSPSSRCAVLYLQWPASRLSPAARRLLDVLAGAAAAADHFASP